MDDEIVVKIQRTIATSKPEEAHVVHLLSLARKLIERVPALQVRQFSVLKFYCDWSLHSKIDRSEAGGTLLAKLHDIVSADLDSPGSIQAFVADLGRALSLDQVRDDLNAIVRQFGGPGETAGIDKWRSLVPIIVEIVSNVPLTNGGGSSRLKAIAQGMQSRPLRGSMSVIESLAIVRNSQIEKTSQDPNVAFWLELATSLNNGTLKFRAPLRLN
jgi:hypothetical protein